VSQRHDTHAYVPAEVPGWSAQHNLEVAMHAVQAMGHGPKLKTAAKSVSSPENPFLGKGRIWSGVLSAAIPTSEKYNEVCISVAPNATYVVDV
jgi:hypothetical protein